MRWSELQTHEFVKIFLSRENLWNSYHEHYKDKNKRQLAFRDLVTEFCEKTGILLNEKEMKTKIKNLRSTYCQELHKIKQRSHSNYRYKPTIRWFADWHRCFQSRTLDNEESQETIDNTDDLKISKDKITHFPIQNNYLDEIKCEPEPAIHESNSYVFDTKKRKLINPHETDTIFNNEHSRSLMEDEFDLYGRYIAAQLRKMDLCRALRLQLEIHSLVNEARLMESDI